MAHFPSNIDPTPSPPAREGAPASRLLERITDAFLATDAAGRLVHANAGAASLLGAPAESLAGRNLLTDFPGALGPMFAPQFLNALRTQRSAVFEVEPGPGASDRWLEGSIYPDEDGVSVCLRDITHHRKAQEAGRKRTRAFMALAEHATDLIQRFDRGLRFVYANHATQRETGLPPMAFLGRTHTDPTLGLPAPLAALWQQEISAVFQTMRPREFKVEHEGPQGTRWFDVRLVPEFDGAGRVESVLAAARDVTVQHRAEARLRESEERFRTLSVSAPIGIFQSDTRGLVQYVNPRAQAIWGASEAELLGAGWMDRVHPEDLPALLRGWHAALLAHGECQLEYRLLMPDGTIRHVRGQAAPLRDAAGAVTGTVGTIEDITERKRMETALADSERSLRLALQAGGMIAWERDLRSDVLRLRLGGTEPDGVLGAASGIPAPELSPAFGNGLRASFSDFLQDLHPDDRERFLAACEDSERSGEEFNQEIRLRQPDGRIRWWKVIGRTVPDLGGRPGRTLGMGLDITREKESLERLAHNEARLAALVSSASDAIVSLDAAGRVILFNPAAERIFGMPKDEMLGASLERILPPKARERHDHNFERFTRTGQNPLFGKLGHLKGLHRDGHEIELEASISHASVAGRSEFTAILRDVTERIRAERERAQYQGELRALTQRLLEQEKETTRRIAEHLHDDLGQTLCALRLIHESGMRRLAKEQRSPDDWLENASALIADANRKVRQVLNDLRPVLLEEVGMQAAMENELLQPYLAGRKPETRLEWAAGDASRRWPPQVEYAFFMIMREAYSNTLRHARAGQVWIRVSGGETSLTMSIEDDGVGTPGLDTLVRPGHLGLVSMRERANAIGALLEMCSAPDAGTRISVAWNRPGDEAPGA
ncbi:PAS domain S-box protein [Caldimonas tepidiphila]|uniref:PAS domain S-box protein n=1 Tax=Caldimonas tepidiphila TaxID=2315841 RepID=UPI000E5C2030|nr:PAS domain S-box protein [Caldimonas tepidiphila]